MIYLSLLEICKVWFERCLNLKTRLHRWLKNKFYIVIREIVIIGRVKHLLKLLCSFISCFGITYWLEKIFLDVKYCRVIMMWGVLRVFGRWIRFTTSLCVRLLQPSNIWCLDGCVSIIEVFKLFRGGEDNVFMSCLDLVLILWFELFKNCRLKLILDKNALLLINKPLQLLVSHEIELMFMLQISMSTLLEDEIRSSVWSFRGVLGGRLLCFCFECVLLFLPPTYSL